MIKARISNYIPIKEWYVVIFSVSLLHRRIYYNVPDSNVHGANMGPTWVL